MLQYRSALTIHVPADEIPPSITRADTMTPVAVPRPVQARTLNGIRGDFPALERCEVGQPQPDTHRLVRRNLALDDGQVRLERRARFRPALSSMDIRAVGQVLANRGSFKSHDVRCLDLSHAMDCPTRSSSIS